MKRLLEMRRCTQRFRSAWAPPTVMAPLLASSFGEQRMSFALRATLHRLQRPADPLPVSPSVDGVVGWRVRERVDLFFSAAQFSPLQHLTLGAWKELVKGSPLTPGDGEWLDTLTEQATRLGVRFNPQTVLLKDFILELAVQLGHRSREESRLSLRNMLSRVLTLTFDTLPGTHRPPCDTIGRVREVLLLEPLFCSMNPSRVLTLLSEFNVIAGADVTQTFVQKLEEESGVAFESATSVSSILLAYLGRQQATSASGSTSPFSAIRLLLEPVSWTPAEWARRAREVLLASKEAVDDPVEPLGGTVVEGGSFPAISVFLKRKIQPELSVELASLLGQGSDRRSALVITGIHGAGKSHFAAIQLPRLVSAAFHHEKLVVSHHVNAESAQLKDFSTPDAASHWVVAQLAEQRCVPLSMSTLHSPGVTSRELEQGPSSPCLPFEPPLGDCVLCVVVDGLFGDCAFSRALLAAQVRLCRELRSVYHEVVFVLVGNGLEVLHCGELGSDGGTPLCKVIAVGQRHPCRPLAFADESSDEDEKPSASALAVLSAPHMFFVWDDPADWFVRVASHCLDPALRPHLAPHLESLKREAICQIFATNCETLAIYVSSLAHLIRVTGGGWSKEQVKLAAVMAASRFRLSGTLHSGDREVLRKKAETVMELLMMQGTARDEALAQRSQLSADGIIYQYIPHAWSDWVAAHPHHPAAKSPVRFECSGRGVGLYSAVIQTSPALLCIMVMQFGFPGVADSWHSMEHLLARYLEARAVALAGRSLRLFIEPFLSESLELAEQSEGERLNIPAAAGRPPPQQAISAGTVSQAPVFIHLAYPYPSPTYRGSTPMWIPTAFDSVKERGHCVILNGPAAPFFDVAYAFQCGDRVIAVLCQAKYTDCTKIKRWSVAALDEELKKMGVGRDAPWTHKLALECMLKAIFPSHNPKKATVLPMFFAPGHEPQEHLKRNFPLRIFNDSVEALYPFSELLAITKRSKEQRGYREFTLAESGAAEMSELKVRLDASEGYREPKELRRKKGGEPAP